MRLVCSLQGLDHGISNMKPKTRCGFVFCCKTSEARSLKKHGLIEEYIEINKKPDHEDQVFYFIYSIAFALLPYFGNTSISSTSKIKVLFGSITSPEPIWP